MRFILFQLRILKLIKDIKQDGCRQPGLQTNRCEPMMQRKMITKALSFIILTFFATQAAAPPPPTLNQCKTRWSLTAGASPAVAFGAFALESGSGTLTMDAAGIVSPSFNVSLSAMSPPATFTVTATNAKSTTVCGTYPFSISWSITPSALLGPAGSSSMPVSVLMNAVDNAGVTLASNVDLSSSPQIFTTANLPVSLTFYGSLSTGAFQQLAGAYTSPFTVDLIQDNATKSISGSTTATSLTPISLIETIAMDFGTVAGGGLTGSIILDVLGTRSVTGDAQILPVGPGVAGEFQLTGEANLSYTIVITEPAVLENGAGNQITATTFTNNSLGTLPATGIEVFQIGATLNLGALQPAGTYVTTTGAGSAYTLTINYN